VAAPTLRESVRRLSGASTDDASNDVVDAALAGRRVRQRLEVCWEGTVDGDGLRTYLAGAVDAWGKLEPVDQTSAEAAGTTLALSDGTTATGDWTLAEDGRLEFDEDQAGATSLQLTVWGYDLNSAAADIVVGMRAVVARDYTVKLGDQTLSRAEATAGLQALERSLRAKALARTVRMTRTDEAPAPRRRGRR
jgi:hypothetical protein